ncbi:hypothetical protein TNCV_3558671 [Trichonephila clavipes]|uniref:Uncharacterized protein n=1 Tax=Trichonephila clavipes TaxID=2585209 RepID=A0A8X7BJ55_TRICX|nr:hypothetical protein TNCV_3558671 [Trichonephila clavipes]
MRQTPCSLYSTDSKPLPFATPAVSITRAHWRPEWRSIVFSNENRFCLWASNDHVLVRRWPGKRQQPSYL